MNQLHILYCLDDFGWNYSRHLAVSLLSLLETNKNNVLHIYVLSSFVSSENQQELERIVTKYKQTIRFVVKPDIIPQAIQSKILNARKELTLATFYRLFFQYHIPDIQADRLLYLDCDTLVNKDLHELFMMDMWGNVLVGWGDVWWMRYWKKKSLGIPYYINAGVLLIDIANFTAIDFGQEIDSANHKHGSNIASDDQDYINIILQWKIKIYDYRINCIINRWFFIPFEDAYVIHLTNKPFLNLARVPRALKEKYYFYLYQTKWKNFDIGKSANIVEYLVYIHDSIRDVCIYIFGKLFGWQWEMYAVQITWIPVFVLMRIHSLFKKIVWWK